ncbi:hypothetical protein Ato02nite_035940 [Paractinoplanes toevensis]|uniref:Uncharacterized protein n=1 Tax=Paractinoplanes toevensis TaxID=571911 RepID=A0A919TBP2_9ACTN|nr:hypothetical protein Ato02nite_035940 [Actinoplanes toevensis]
MCGRPVGPNPRPGQCPRLACRLFLQARQRTPLSGTTLPFGTTPPFGTMLPFATTLGGRNRANNKATGWPGPGDHPGLLATADRRRQGVARCPESAAPSGMAPPIGRGRRRVTAGEECAPFHEKSIGGGRYAGKSVGLVWG